MARIPRVQTTDRIINQLQQNMINALGPVISNPLVNGVLVTNVSLASGNNQIAHGLGRTPQGWFPVRIRSAATFYESASPSELFLSLNASAAVVVDLYIF